MSTTLDSIIIGGVYFIAALIIFVYLVGIYSVIGERGKNAMAWMFLLLSAIISAASAAVPQRHRLGFSIVAALFLLAAGVLKK